MKTVRISNSGRSVIKLNFVKEQYQFGNRVYHILKVGNLDNLVDQVSDDQFNVDERLPYWAELWPSAIALSRFIVKNSGFFANRRILELGCGLGLTSMVLMLQQPAYFLCSDYEAEALQLTRQNFEDNKISLPHFQVLDWRNPQLQETFDLIIASDILYEKRFFQPLLDLFKNCQTPRGRIIVAEPNRSIAREFFLSLEERGYSFSRICEPVEQGRQTIAVSIYNISR